ncbi:MAG: hypothetical protein EOR03_31415 [Mesorhizobium sp.]|nr:MAG: hypothetical protein EOR03_31415 [Mesorhizobium sp.]
MTKIFVSEIFIFPRLPRLPEELFGSESLQLCAAPHLPAGILSPYSDGERDALFDGFANHQRCRISAMVRPVPGRAMRGGADSDN